VTDAAELIDFGVVIAVGVLEAGDHFGSILHFQVCLQDFDVHLLAFSRSCTGSAGIIESQVTIVSFKKLRDGGGGGHIDLNVEAAV